MPRLTRIAPCLALAAAAAFAALPASAVQRAFVASTGSDANSATSCGFSAPCRSFSTAQTVLDPGGEIVALDAAGYGAITITKSLTLTANPGFYAGIAASSGVAVTIATAGVNVTLRGLNINGIGGTDGVMMTAGNRLSIENCVISNFTTSGVTINTAGTAVTARIVDSLIRDNGSLGLLSEDGSSVTVSNTKFLHNASANLLVRTLLAGTTATATVRDSVTAGGTVGMASFASAATSVTHLTIIGSTITYASSWGALASNGAGTQILSIGSSQVSENAVGLENLGTGVLESQGNNLVRNNASNSSGTITTVGSM